MKVVQKAKELIPGMVGEYPSKAKIYRERGGTPKLEEAGAIKMEYDDLPDMHKIDTGEETKSVDLEAIIESYENKDEEDATYIIEGVEGPDGKKRDLVLRNVYEDGDIQKTDTFDGTSTIHFYEAQDGQLVNWTPKFMDTDKIDGDLHRDANDDENWDDIGIRPYLIDNKDEKLNAWMDHLKRKYEKYSGGEGFWSEHFEIAVILGVGLSVAMIYYAVLGNIGDLIPLVQKLVDAAPNTGIEQAAMDLAQAGSGGESSSPPPGN